jgi:hypothetical protein
MKALFLRGKLLGIFAILLLGERLVSLQDISRCLDSVVVDRL